jgi:hypothetical protein
MKWLYNNWYASTPLLAIYLLIFLVIFVLEENFALFLIWLQTVVYFFHQFEEYILPGGFVAFFNTKALGSKKADFPLDKKSSFWINIPIVFIAYPLSAILAGNFDISLGVWTAYFSIINALSHVGIFFKYGYNPGLVASVFLNIPVGIYTLYYLSTNNIISLQTNLIGLSIGVLVQIAVMTYGFLVLKPKVQ